MPPLFEKGFSTDKPDDMCISEVFPARTGPCREVEK
jgi:hypothetical protein